MQYLSWPLKFYHFNFRGKDYVFFGEQHDTQHGCEKFLKYQCNFVDKNRNKVDIGSSCWNFDYFLLDLYERCVREKRYMDFFFEYAYRPKHQEIFTGGPTSEGYLFTIRDTVAPCISEDRSNCKYLPYVRTHYSDARMLVAENRHSRAFTTPAFLTEIGTDMLREKTMRYRSINKFLKDFKDIWVTYDLQEEYIKAIVSADDASIQTYFNILKELPDNILSMNLIRNSGQIRNNILVKQLNRLKSDYIVTRNGTNIADFIVQHCIDTYRKFNVMERIKKLPFLSKDSTQSEINTLESTLKILSVWGDTIIMDIYTLARMFRKFDNRSQVCIFYGGTAHAKFYSNFFLNYLTRENFQIESAPVKMGQCIPSYYIQNLFQQPEITSVIFTIDIFGEPILFDREGLYGLIVGSRKNVHFGDININIMNVNFILRVGSDQSSYVIDHNNADYYFNTNSFLTGLHKGITLHNNDGDLYGIL